MIKVRPQDAIHKAWLLRLLVAIIDDTFLAENLYFKGGTAASMLGFLDRFSVDLDFDLKNSAYKKEIRDSIRKIVKNLELNMYYEDKTVLLFSLKYPALKNQRNTIKLSITDITIKANKYKVAYLAEINRNAVCQTIETMFANKLVALTDRYEKNKTIAGRDIYDIHHFFINGYRYDKEVISFRTGMTVSEYLIKLISFIDKNINQTVINEDLNTLLPYEQFIKVRKIIKTEVVMFLKNEIANQQ